MCDGVFHTLRQSTDLPLPRQVFSEANLDGQRERTARDDGYKNAAWRAF